MSTKDGFLDWDYGDKWEWWRYFKTISLFQHLLLKAVYKDGKRGGVSVKKGQVVTSYGQLAKENGISGKLVRICLNRLVKSNEIDIEAANELIVITIRGYDEYLTPPVKERL